MKENYNNGALTAKKIYVKINIHNRGIWYICMMVLFVIRS